MPEPVDLNFVTTDVMGGSVLQWADTFTSTKDLVDQAIAKLKPGQCIRRLVIAGHGAEKTDGFFVFDPETRGVEWIDGAQKQPIAPDVVNELQRLRANFCKDAVIEFRVCRFGIGKKGEKAMQAVADAAGVAVTAPMGEISSLAAIGGLATDWRVAYPTSWGLPAGTSFWRGRPTRQPAGTPAPGDIAPVTGQVVPLRNVSTVPPTPLPPVRKVAIVNPNPAPVDRLIVAATGVAVSGVILGWMLFGGQSPGTPLAANLSPTARATTTASALPRATATATPAPTASPTAQPTLSPTATPQAALLPPDGRYFGDGMFVSFDGRESYHTAWRLTKAGGAVEIAQLLRAGGRPFQTANGIADPSGVMVAVIDDPSFCEVLLLPVDKGMPAGYMYVAYGPRGMACPTPNELALVFVHNSADPNVLDVVVPEQYGWSGDVTVGHVRIDNWSTQ